MGLSWFPLGLLLLLGATSFATAAGDDPMLVLNALPPHMFRNLASMVPNLYAFLQRHTDHKSGWHDMASESRHPIREIIRHLGRELVPGPPEGGNYSGVEFWVQRRKSSKPLYMHFDVAEGLKANHELALPQWSCILYMSDCGGPTLVLNNTLTNASKRPDTTANLHPSAISDGILIYPEPNALARFRGNLLHGMIPHVSTGELLLGLNGLEDEEFITVSGRTGLNSVLNGVYTRNETGVFSTLARGNELWLWKVLGTDPLESDGDWFVGDKEDIGTRIGYATFKGANNEWHVVNKLSKFVRDSEIKVERGNLYSTYFCNRTTVLFNFWTRAIASPDFRDEDFPAPPLSPQRPEGHSASFPELITEVPSDATATQEIEIRMPHTEAEDWEPLCIDLQIPSQNQEETRGTMVLVPAHRPHHPRTCRQEAVSKPQGSSSKNPGVCPPPELLAEQGTLLALTEFKLTEAESLLAAANLRIQKMATGCKVPDRQECGHGAVTLLVSKACETVGQGWSSTAKQRFEHIMSEILEPVCGAPFSIQELQSMSQAEWQHDVLDPLTRKEEVGSRRAKLLASTLKDLLPKTTPLT